MQRLNSSIAVISQAAATVLLTLISKSNQKGSEWEQRGTSAVFMSVEDRVSVTGAGSPPRVQAGLL